VRIRQLQQRLKQDERGLMLLGASMAVVLMLTLQGAFLSRSLTQAGAARRTLEARQGLYLAEGAVEVAIDWARRTGQNNLNALPRYNPDRFGFACLNDGNPTSDSRGTAADPDEVVLPASLTNFPGATLQGPITEFPLGAPAPCSIVVQEFNPAYNATNANPAASYGGGPVTPSPVAGAYYVIARVVTGPNNTPRLVRALIQLERLQQFAYFQNGIDDAPGAGSEDVAWLTTNTFISGPVFYNGYMFFQGSPTFELGLDPWGRPEMVGTHQGTLMYWYPNWTTYPYDHPLTPGFYTVNGVQWPTPWPGWLNGGTMVPAWGSTQGGGGTDPISGGPTPGDGVTPLNQTPNGDTLAFLGEPNNDPRWLDPNNVAAGLQPLPASRVNLKATPKPFPDPDATFTLLFGEARTGGLAFRGHAEIALEPGGIRVITGDTYDNPTGGAFTNRNGQLLPMPAKPVVCNDDTGGGGNNLIIQASTLDGQLTICSERNVILAGNIQYADNNLATSDDLLGVVAKENINIQRAAALQDPVFYGVYMALQDSFGYEVFNPPDMLSAPDLGTIQVYGSVVENIPGAKGMLDNLGGHHGYYAEYRFDRRLYTESLPYFPLDGCFKLLSIEYLPQGGG